MFFKIKRNPRKTTRQTLNTEQLEPKAMFSVSPVEPVVALDVGPVNQTGYEFQAKDYTIPCYTEFFKPTHNDGLRAHPGGDGLRNPVPCWPEFLRVAEGEDGRSIVHPNYNVGLNGLAQANQQPSLTAIRDVDIASESVGGSAGPGGDDIFMPKPNREIVGGGKRNGYAEAVGLDSSTLENSSSDSYSEVEWTYFVGGGKGSGYAEAVGLGSSTVDDYQQSNSYSEVEWTYSEARQEVFARMVR